MPPEWSASLRQLQDEQSASTPDSEQSQDELRHLYLAPELREDGTVRTDVLISGRYPRFGYDPIDALYYGFDANASLRLGPFDLNVQASLVRANNVETGEFLLFIPSLAIFRRHGPT